MSKKHRDRESGDVAIAATEPNPVAEQPTREQLLQHLSAAYPGDDFSNSTDEELLEFAQFGQETETIEDEPIDEPTEVLQETPVEVVSEPTEQLVDARAMIARLEAEIAKINAGRGSKVKSGSAARPNVKYVLLVKPPKWHDTPQVAQLEQTFFADDVLAKYAPTDADADLLTKVGAKNGAAAVIPEPELFELVRAAHSGGVLRTKQDPVRIFQYYRSTLMGANVMRWE